MRVAYLSGRPLLLLVLALGLAGCSTQALQGDTEAGLRIALPGIALPAEPAPQDRGKDRGDAKKERADAKTDRKPAEARKAPAVAVAKSPGKLPTAERSEDTCVDVEKCASVLKTMVGGSDRSWIRKPASPSVLANGVRLFAYRALRPTLSCNELAAALAEIGTAKRTFSRPVPGLEPVQVERVKSLSDEVDGELRAERERRCRPDNKGEGEGSVG
jgi:hypothetical protein